MASIRESSLYTAAFDPFPKSDNHESSFRFNNAPGESPFSGFLLYLD